MIGGAIRLDGATFRNAVAGVGETRLHLAIVAVAALSSGFAYATEAVSGGLVAERDFALYRLLILVGVAETAVQFIAFVGVIHVMRLITRRPAIGFGALCRLMALGLAPVCFVFLGPMFGVQDWVRGGLIAWRIVISIVALKIGTDSSWITAVLTVLGADFVSSPFVKLLLFGLTPRPGGPALPA